jgi:hypothetical protein
VIAAAEVTVLVVVNFAAGLRYLYYQELQHWHWQIDSKLFVSESNHDHDVLSSSDSLIPLSSEPGLISSATAAQPEPESCPTVTVLADAAHAVSSSTIFKFKLVLVSASASLSDSGSELEGHGLTSHPSPAANQSHA